MSRAIPREGSGAERDQGGIALIVALLVVVILVVITVQFTYTTTIDLKLVRNQSRELKSYYAARGVVALARARLLEDLIRDGGLFAPDSLQDPWAAGGGGSGEKEHAVTSLIGGKFRRTIGDVPVEYEIVDEARKICVNNLALERLSLPGSGQAESPREMQPPSTGAGPGSGPNKPDAEVLAEERKEMTRKFIREILVQLEVGVSEAEGIVGAIEEGAPYSSIRDLRRVDGISPELLEGSEDEFGRKPGLADFLTVHSWGEININTAPRQVLIAFLSTRYGEDAASYAEKILDFRDPPQDGQPEEGDATEQGGDEDLGPSGGVFAKVDDLAREVPGLEDIFGPTEPDTPDSLSEGQKLRRQLTIWSRFFSIKVTDGDKAPRKQYTFVLKRGLTPEVPIPLILWEERELPPLVHEPQ